MIIHGDCVELMQKMDAESVDAVVCDPPYGLEFMGREWDSFKPANAKIRTRTDLRTNGTEKSVVSTPEAYKAGSPFQAWCEAWATEALRVLKPGGHLLAFGGTRTYHRLAAGIEDAGFQIRDTIAWIFGSGFPKSLDVSKAIDGAEAAEWAGWGTALKPAYEPVVVARKPLAGTVAKNVLAHGTGGLNIDGCRVGDSKQVPASPRVGANGGDAGGVYGKFESPPTDTAGWDPNVGRWPANVMLDEAAADQLDEAAGERGGSGPASGPTLREGNTSVARGKFNGLPEGVAPAFYGDSGGPSRFFYTAKSSSAERSAGLDVNPHPTVKPIDVMRWLVRLVTPLGGLVLDPFAGSGTTGCAAHLEGMRFVGCEMTDEYVPIAEARIAFWSKYPPGTVTAAVLDETRPAPPPKVVEGQESLFGPVGE